MHEPQIIPSRNFDYFNEMIAHPDIYPSIHDDVDVKVPDVSVIGSEENVFLEVRADGHAAGFGMFVYEGDGRYEMHCGVTHAFAGRFALDAGKAMLAWIFDKKRARMITTYIWSNAVHVIWAARRIGFVETGRKPWPNPVHGAFVDSIHYAILSPETN